MVNFPKSVILTVKLRNWGLTALVTEGVAENRRKMEATLKTKQILARGRNVFHKKKTAALLNVRKKYCSTDKKYGR